MKVKQYRKHFFVRTCRSSPEQYDVYNQEGNQVGYVRLRYGDLSVACPDIGGEHVYETTVGDGQWTGEFESKEQRKRVLKEISKAISKWEKRQKEENV